MDEPEIGDGFELLFEADDTTGMDGLAESGGKFAVWPWTTEA